MGWMALIGVGKVLKQVTAGHSSAQSAVRALDGELAAKAARGSWNAPLVRRLLAYAAGRPVDFSDVELDLSRLSPFQRRAIERCRKIPYGKTLTYGQLAAAAGSPRAARAVGNCMAANRFMLVVPCHRVLPASGRVGSYSGPGGGQMKKMLLAMEAENAMA
jgi:methylated-DNA-[protein]-cysteine S-methyltransferase